MNMNNKGPSIIKLFLLIPFNTRIAFYMCYYIQAEPTLTDFFLSHYVSLSVSLFMSHFHYYFIFFYVIMISHTNYYYYYFGEKKS